MNDESVTTLCKKCFDDGVRDAWVTSEKPFKQSGNYVWHLFECPRCQDKVERIFYVD